MAAHAQVQQYLVSYVYRRLPGHSRAARQSGVLFFSAFWHGVRPGYYVCFAIMFCMVCVEKLVLTAVRTSRTLSVVAADAPLLLRLVADVVSWILRPRAKYCVAPLDCVARTACAR